MFHCLAEKDKSFVMRNKHRSYFICAFLHYVISSTRLPFVNFGLITDLLRSYPLKLLTGIPLKNTVKLLIQNIQSTNEARVAIC